VAIAPTTTASAAAGDMEPPTSSSDQWPVAATALSATTLPTPMSTSSVQ